MPRARDTRLARLAVRATWAETDEIRRRASLEGRVAVGEALRCLLPQLGIDPDRLATLCVCDEAAAELAAMPAPHPAAAPRQASRRKRGDGGLRRRAPSPRKPGEGEEHAIELNARLDALVQRYRDNPDIDFSQASLSDALAWCIAQSEAGASHFAADLLQKQRQDDPEAVTE